MSGFNWKAEAEKEGQQSERIPDGTWLVEITKIINGKKNQPFVSEDGDPQILVVFTDQEDREQGEFYTLSGKAAWKLARMLSAAGLNLDKMTEKGIEPKQFADPAFANANLVGRRLTIEVKYEKPGDKYPRINPVKPQPGAEKFQKAADAMAGVGSSNFDPSADLKGDDPPF